MVHGALELEPVYTAPLPPLSAALTDPAAKAKWLTGAHGEEGPLEREVNVRAGGREPPRGRWQGGVVATFETTYLDVIANERLIYALPPLFPAMAGTQICHPGGLPVRIWTPAYAGESGGCVFFCKVEAMVRGKLDGLYSHTYPVRGEMLERLRISLKRRQANDRESDCDKRAQSVIRNLSKSGLAEDVVISN